MKKKITVIVFLSNSFEPIEWNSKYCNDIHAIKEYLTNFASKFME
jgi:hypothetical protein